MNTFLTIVLGLVTALIAVGFGAVRRGPTVFDRLVAVSLVSANGVVVLAVLGFVLGRPDFFLDIAVGYALLAFTLPIALSKYFERGRGEEDGP